MKHARSVDEYISGAPEDIQEKLLQLRSVIKSTAPAARESVSYGMAYYAYRGRLVYFGYQTHHIGLYIPPADSPGF